MCGNLFFSGVLTIYICVQIYSQGQSTTLSVLLIVAVFVKIVAFTINVFVIRNEEKKFYDDNTKISHNNTVKHIVL